MNRVDLLRSIPMFESLGDQDLDELASELTERRLAAGEVLFEAGDVGSAMYLVAEGLVNIHLPGDPATRVSLADLSVGAYFGEVALFDDKPRSASAQAQIPTVLLELGRDVLTSYLEKRPRAAMAILRTMSERLRQTNAMLSERAARNVIEEFEKGLSWADRLADKVAELNGSWSFILSVAAIVAVWVVTNVPGLLTSRPLDAYPYQFFNLVLAIVVTLQGPLIVMSQNRQAAKDRKEAETDFKVNLKNEVNIETILKELRELRAQAATMQIERHSDGGRDEVRNQLAALRAELSGLGASRNEEASLSAMRQEIRELKGLLDARSSAAAAEHTPARASGPSPEGGTRTAARRGV